MEKIGQLKKIVLKTDLAFDYFKSTEKRFQNIECIVVTSVSPYKKFLLLK